VAWKSICIEDLVQLLMQRGCCDQKTVERGRRVAADSGQRLEAVMLQLGLVTERDLAEAYAGLLALPIAQAERYPAAPLLGELLTGRFLRSARVIPVAMLDEHLVIAAADPMDAFAPAAITAATGMRVRLEVAVPIELEAAFDRLYSDAPIGDAALGDEVELDAPEPLEEDAERLKDLASEAPVIRLVNQIITRAVETQASDIHFEPFEDRLRLRYRYDGVLHEAESPPVRLTAAITSRIKIMAALDIAERRLPQDGRIKLAVRGQTVDFRVSTIPTLHGETVVLRVLDRGSVEFDYAKLGLPERVVNRLSEALALPDGVVLVTGPTGSGKTTTLYTSLLALNSTSRKIVTLEDPIEYQLHGINQIQVKRQIGLTFVSLLPFVLRQDPNVIMLGEMRDPETAQMAAQSALTGHLVLSTLHTNSAAASITRLRDMGLEDYLLTAVLRGILAQRLVRRLCPACSVAAVPDAATVARYGIEERCHGRKLQLWHPVGCDLCRQTGYRGRQAIAEFLVVDSTIERLIISHADHNDIERAAVAAGMVTMFDAGLDAALDGITTLDEVVRSIRVQV
jgi:general secretion pathway protein E